MKYFVSKPKDDTAVEFKSGNEKANIYEKVDDEKKDDKKPEKKKPLEVHHVYTE